ncbi:FxsB family cyclophane-forming radical SAM/SPASM peptide maturase [Streptomyces sp. NPDC021093]|uniref:FxsB family cyclophane-forming radical SAM/SPASM peptide maturase n=1 Tax=Streptomyces sp. NPDC021093 TaxID=3365112 RepID=UPI00379032A3
MPAATRPFRQFVVKVHSRCDLACDHCYVYRHADQSWRGRPVTMSQETFRLTAARIAEHAARHGLSRVHVVFHGGEPLLAGRERLRGHARELRRALHGVSGLDLRMQTNGLCLDEDFCAMLADEHIVTGISLDGDRVSHDRHRIRNDGSGSHADVLRAVRLLGAPAHRSAFGGLLCTVDVANDPVAVYRALAELDPPGIDFLLPHATWDRPPPRPGGGTDYADWLIAVHRRWTADGRPVPIRIFDSISRLDRGGPSLTEALGPGSSDLLVVETDGAVEQADWLKTVAHGAPETGFHVAYDSFDEAAAHPGFQARRTGPDGLCAQCRSCPVVAVCGGGLYGHRFRTPDGSGKPDSGTPGSGTSGSDSLGSDTSGSGIPDGFDNPSVYCADLLKLIPYVQQAADGTELHALAPAHFDDLAAGHGGAPALRELAEAQSSLRRVLLAAARRAAPHPAAAWDAVFALPFDALEVLLADPYLRVWALRCCAGRPPDSGRPAESALAAAVRTGGRLSLTVPLRHGATVQLPGLGRLLVDTGIRSIRLAAGAEGLAVEGRPLDALPEGVVWQPLRHLDADGIRVALDDIDPYRTCYRAEAAPRLSESGVRAWQETFREAWRLIRTEHPRYAAGLAALTTVTPLAAPPPGTEASETSRDAFGAVGVALPSSPEALALLLVHEFQHVKLGALQDMFDLLDGSDDGRYPVAWREDPRPPDAVLQGAYAHLAVADVWRTRSLRRTQAADDAAADAVHRAEYWRDGVLAALDTLAGTGALTGLGRRLVTGMRTAAKGPGDRGTGGQDN